MAGDEAGVTLGQPHLSRQDLSTLVRTWPGRDSGKKGANGRGAGFREVDVVAPLRHSRSSRGLRSGRKLVESAPLTSLSNLILL